MILGKIIGKASTQGFEFHVEQPTKKFEYLQVAVSESSEGKEETIYVLCQIIELEQEDEIIAKCIALGYKDNEGKIKLPRTPFKPGTEVLKANDDFIKQIIQLDEKKGAYIGKLDGKDIKVYLDLRKMLNRHVSVLAKSGAGKSYSIGVLLEEIMEKKVPLLIIDPHGEYSQMKYPNDNENEKKLYEKFDIKSKTYIRQIQEFGDFEANPGVKPLKLSDDFDVGEIAHIMPGKLNANQLACLYAAIKNLRKVDIESLIFELETQESNVKWTIIDNLDYLRRLGIFSNNYTSLKEIVQPGICTIINLKGIDPDISEIIVYKLLKDLFDARKKDIIPPFFAVVEEAHNFAPERSFGETKCSKIMRTIASEGRKFGLGLCVVSQRPARVDKSVLSQCNTQVILKVTNPNDLRAISGSVEGITAESETEIRNLPIGTALITGIVEMPLFVNIRPRRTKHGGESVNMVNDDIGDEEDFYEQAERCKEDKLIPLIKPKTSKKDLQLMSDKPIKEIKTYLVPGAIFTCKQESKTFQLLVELTQGKIIIDPEKNQYVEIPEFNKLSPLQLEFVQRCIELNSFTMNEIMQATGLNFIKTQDMITALSRQGYFEFKDGKYSLSKSVALNLSDHSYYGRIEFDKVEYEMILDKAVSPDSVKDKLERFADVTEIKDCFIVWHKLIYGQDGDIPKE